MQKRGLVLLVLLLAPCVLAQDFIQKGAIPDDASPAEIVAALAKPAVVQIQSHTKISAQVPDLKFENGKVTETGPGSRTEFDRTGVGSGFIVTPDGYVVTNAHVLLPHQDDVMTPFLVNVFNKRGIPAELQKQFGDYLGNILQLQIVPGEPFVMLPVYGYTGLTQAALPAEVKKIGVAYPGKDVAVLKVSRKNLPTVSISKSEPPVGSNVLVIGYPLAAKIGLVPESTVTSGVLSAYKQSETGWRMAQIDAAISSGSSGGPVFGKDGRVIGVATLSAGKAAGFNWLVPNDVVYEFLNELNVHPRRGVLDQVYERGVANYWNKRYERAIVDFHHSLELMPNHPMVPELLFNSRAALEEQAQMAYTWKVGMSVFGAVLLIIVIFLFIYTYKEKKEIAHLRRRLRRT